MTLTPKLKACQLEQVAIAIERADKERAPDSDEFDHPEVSDWGIHIARAAIAAYESTRTDPSAELLEAAKLAFIALAPRKDDDFVWAAMTQLTAAITKAESHPEIEGESQHD